MSVVKDFMTRDPITVSVDRDIDSVARLFEEKRITSTPVVDRKGELVGILSELVLMRLLLSQMATPQRKVLVSEHLSQLHPVSMIDEGASLKTAVMELLKSPTHRVVVTTKSGDVVGVVSPKDILAVLKWEIENSRKHEDAVGEYSKKISATKGMSLELYRALYENSPYMMQSVDEHGHIMIANKKTHEALGYKPDELIGKSFRDLYLDKYWVQAEEGLRQVAKGTVVDSVKTSMKTKKGASIPVEIKTTGLRDTHGHFIATISVVRRLDTDAQITSIMDLIGVFQDSKK